MASVARVIQLANLSKNYGKKPGIRDVDLVVNQGEIFGYLGPNGAGKTTTIRLMVNLIRPNTGTIRIFDQPVSHRSPDLRRRIGYLPGELALYSRLTVKELLRYFARLRGGVDWAFVHQLAERLNCELDHPIRSLSRGNKQKAGIIAALMHKPDLLILDEPTSGLDPLIRQEFYQILLEQRAAGQTVFLSSHILPEVERVCHRVGIIRNARLVTVEETEVLKQKSVREVTIQFEQPVDSAYFSGIPNLRKLKIEGTVMRCRVVGNMGALMSRAAPLGVVDVISRQPDLQEIFLTFYGENDHEI